MQFSSSFKSQSEKFSGFKTSSFSVKQRTVDFSKAMNSLNIETLNFTNYFMPKSPLIKFVKKECAALMNNAIDIEDGTKYVPTIVNYSDLYLKFKLITIIERTRNKRNYELVTIYKFKNMENREFQIYATRDENYNYEVVAIDLYHLLIPAPDTSKNEVIEHSKEKYETYKLANYNLSNLNIISTKYSNKF